MTIDTATLSALPYFRGIPAPDLEALRLFFFEKSFTRGEMVFNEGEPADTLFFLVTGIVKIFKTSAQGKEQIITLARPHEVLNDVSVFDGGPNPCGAEAMGDVTVYGIKRDRLDELLKQHPVVTGGIIRVLSERNRQLLSLVEDLSFRHVIGRVAKILLEHAPNGDNPGQRLTQQEMAAMAGTAREVVARSLKVLEDRGVIRLDRHRIVIPDRKALQDMVGEAA